MTKCSDFIHGFHVHVETLEQMAHHFVEDVVHCRHGTLRNRISHPAKFGLNLAYVILVIFLLFELRRKSSKVERLFGFLGKFVLLLDDLSDKVIESLLADDLRL